jgi:hypothetical protein
MFMLGHIVFFSLTQYKVNVGAEIFLYLSLYLPLCQLMLMTALLTIMKVSSFFTASFFLLCFFMFMYVYSL